MSMQLNQILTPESLGDLFTTWGRYPDAVPFAGGTNIIGSQSKNLINLPKIVLSLEKIEELRRITRTEQYLEIGAMVKLNQVFRLGRIVPVILYKCIEQIAGVQLRNIATIGGNISTGVICDLPAVFCALDAQYELRCSNSARWAPAARFHAGNVPFKPQEILTRIRLPLIQWDYSIYKKILSEDNRTSDVLVFLAKAQKTILSDLRVVYKSASILRNRNSEDAIMGRSLPINRKTAADFVLNWKEFLKNRSEVSEFSKNALLNNIEENIFILSE